MNTVITDKCKIEQSHNEWLTCLFACEEELLHLDAVTHELQKSVNALALQPHLHQLRHEILLQRGVIEKLNEEVMGWAKTFSGREDKKIISIQELIQNNKVRDKVRKTEQNIFMLKYQVNKLLSLAS